MKLNEFILAVGFSMTAIGSVISVGMIVTQQAITVITSKGFYLSGSAIVLGLMILCIGFLMDTNENQDPIKEES
jgi:hypothetical protein|tara:strand:+ start:8034 stop:8255 length:222 start_codon:yes stop_codon:yes gene_type:complete